MIPVEISSTSLHHDKQGAPTDEFVTEPSNGHFKSAENKFCGGRISALCSASSSQCALEHILSRSVGDEDNCCETISQSTSLENSLENDDLDSEESLNTALDPVSTPLVENTPLKHLRGSSKLCDESSVHDERSNLSVTASMVESAFLQTNLECSDLSGSSNVLPVQHDRSSFINVGMRLASLRHDQGYHQASVESDSAGKCVFCRKPLQSSVSCMTSDKTRFLDSFSSVVIIMTVAVVSFFLGSYVTASRLEKAITACMDLQQDIALRQEEERRWTFAFKVFHVVSQVGLSYFFGTVPAHC